MKIEDKVVSLELAKRMKELGWEFETERYWWQHCNKVHQGYENHPPEYLWALQPYFKGLNLSCAIPAPDAIEIGNELPYHSEGYKLWRCCSQKMIYSYQANHTEQNKNLSEALGKMWCYLKEKGLI